MPERSPTELHRLRSMVNELAGINDIVAAVSGQLAIQQVTEILIDKILKYLQASQGAVFLVTGRERPSDEPTAFVRSSYRTAQGSPDHLTTFVRRTSGTAEELPLHLNRNLAAWILKNKRLLVVNDPERETPLADVDLPSLGINSLLAAPLRLGTRVIGILVAFNKQDAAGFTKQDERFLGILGAQCSQALEASRLYEEEKNLATLRQELQMAREIQRRFLPAEEGCIDRRQACGFNLPAREVGGDFYEIQPLPDGRLFFSVGDVCGKGMPAALLMSNVVAIQRSHLSRGNDLSLLGLAANINSVLCHFVQPGQFVCGIFALLNPATCTLEWVNAGHPPPIIVSDHGHCEAPGESDLLLGVFEDTPYAVRKTHLPAESMVCLYTDGVTEATDASGELFGEERLVRLLESGRSESAEDTCRSLREAVMVFQGSEPQSDDITVVVVRAPLG